MELAERDRTCSFLQRKAQPPSPNVAGERTTEIRISHLRIDEVWTVKIRSSIDKGMAQAKSGHRIGFSYAKCRNLLCLSLWGHSI